MFLLPEEPIISDGKKKNRIYEINLNLSQGGGRMRKLVIDNKSIQDDADCFVIAEIGHNHQGSL